MLRALLWFGFAQLRLERIWLDVYDVNPGARRVYELVGFVHEGTLRHATYADGHPKDLLRMGIIREDWDALTRLRSWDLNARDAARRSGGATLTRSDGGAAGQ